MSERRLLLPGKNNLASKPSGLAFTIEGDPPVIRWEEAEVTMTANECAQAMMNAKKGPAPDDRKAAEEFLHDALADGPRLAKELTEEAKEILGASKSTVDRAKQHLKIVSFRKTNPGPWWWRRREAFETDGNVDMNLYTDGIKPDTQPPEADTLEYLDDVLHTNTEGYQECQDNPDSTHIQDTLIKQSDFDFIDEAFPIGGES